MPDLYCTRADVYELGKLPRTTLANPARRCSANATTDTVELDGHGFETDQEIVFPRAEGNGSLPAPLVAGTAHYAIRVNESQFKVAAAPGGPAIDLTTSGSNPLVATPLPFDKTIEAYSRHVDDYLPAHAVPLQPPIPPHVVLIVAKLVAKEMLLGSAQQSGAMTEVKAEAREELLRWAKGIKLRDAKATASANLSYSESVPTASTRGGTLP